MLKNIKPKKIINGPFAWQNYHPILMNIGVFLLFVVFASISNYSLLLGENIMKWDIWDAEYPSQVLMTDALANGTIIKWNPLMQFGTPTYAMVGTPVWYPITLLLALVGYTPSVLAFSYVIHVAIGGFGMFLLGQQEQQQLSNQWNVTSLLISFLVGLIYCNSGLFLSNAQHIMIIISASWIPYIFFFMRKYLESHCIVYAMLAGGSAGMAFLGGYPELFYDAFLFLAPYTLYFQFDRQKKVINNLFGALGHYIIVCVFTILCSAISLLPFLNIMGLLTRTSGYGQMPNNFDMGALLSVLFPGTAAFAYTGEISMVNFYVSILSILLIPSTIKLKNKNKNLYLGIALVAFILCLGSSTFFHGILYRFLPMYSSFRFPSINRCILAVFLLLNIVNVLQDIFDRQDVRLPLKISKLVFLLVMTLAIVASLIVYFGNDSSDLNRSNVLSFMNSAYLTVIIVGGYLILFYNIQVHEMKVNLLRIAMLGIVILDLAIFHYAAFPLTIATYNQIAYHYDSGTQAQVKNEFLKNSNRNKTIDFADSTRASNKLNSQSIAFNKYLDADGYVSILLQSTQDYKSSYLRSIMEQNPEAYFTNDIVTESVIEYSDWISKGDIPPEQIYTDGEQTITENKIRFRQKELYSVPLMITTNDKNVCIEGPISAGELKTGRLRFFFDSSITGSQNLTVSFYDGDEHYIRYEGDYLIEANENGYYVDIYFPNIDATYSKVEVTSFDVVPTSAELLYVERMQRDEYVNIDSFGFNDITMRVDAPTDGYVTLLQAKYNGWKAYVDGVETVISTVDNCFMGVKVSEGKHSIIFKFRPTDFYIGATISFLFVVLLCGTIIYVILAKNKK